MSHTESTVRFSIRAVLCLALGLSSLGLLFFTGVPALVMGWLALREINASDGVIKGRVLAFIGMALGAFASVAGVVGIIALALLQVRADSERVLCQDRLRHIGSALQLYRTDNKHFPPATVPNASLPPEQRLSWYVFLLEQIEIQPDQPTHPRQKKWDELYAALDLKQGWEAEANAGVVRTPVRWFRCPARPDSQADMNTNYIGLTGVGVNAAQLPIESPNAGFFGFGRTTELADIKAGTSETMILTETSWRTGPWAAGGFPTVRGLDPDDLPYIGPGRPWGGLHPDGLNVLFADGSVRFIAASIDPIVFQNFSLLNREPEAGN